MDAEETFPRDTTLRTHSWYEAHLDAFLLDLLKLRTASQPPAGVMIPEYTEYSCQKMFIRIQSPTSKPITRFDQTQWSKTPRQVFSLFFAILDAGIFVHQQGAVLRQIALENILAGKSGYKVIPFYQESQQNTLTVNCPLEYCSPEFYNYAIYVDKLNFAQQQDYRKYLAFPAELRLRQKIKFSVNVDIYSIGKFIYQIVTGQQPPSPFDAEDLETQRLTAQKILQKYPFGELFNKVVMKMLFLIDTYYYNLLEVQQDVNIIYKLSQGKQMSTGTMMSYDQFKTLNAAKSNYSVTTIRTVIDHLLGTIQYSQVQQLKLKTHLYQNQQLNSATVAFIQSKKQLETFAETYSSQDLNKIFAGDKSGRLAILQGYIGSGKTQVLYDILSFYSTQVFSFACYIPLRSQNCFSRFSLDNLDLIPSTYLKQTKIVDFYHYILIYVLYAVQQLSIPKTLQKIQKAFQSQNDINKLSALCPGFYQFINVGQNSKLIQITSDITKEVLYKILDIILQTSLLVVMGFDDLQSNQHQNETKILFTLLESFPRLCVITTEVPSMQVSQQSFSITGTSNGRLTQEVCSLFDYFSEQLQQADQPVEKRTTTQMYSDIMSVGSCLSDNQQQRGEQNKGSANEIKTQTFIAQQSQKKKLSAIFISVNYLTQTQMEEYLSNFGLKSQDLVLSAYRKSQGSIRNIKLLLQQLFQQSGWLQQSMANYVTLESVQSDDVQIFASYLRAKQMNQIQQKELEILQICSALGYFVDQNWLIQIMELRMEQIQSLCTQLGSQNGYIFSFALPHVNMKHKTYLNSNQNYQIENVFVWQSTLACKVFLESFTTQFSNNLFSTAKFLLTRYQNQFSFIEISNDRLQFFIPVLQGDKLDFQIENLVDDINAEYGMNVKQCNQKSSLVKLLRRTSPVRLTSQLRPFVQKVMSADNFGTNYDGLFVSIEQLTLCLNPCTSYLPDIFDQIELMQLNQSLLKNVKFYGLIPKIYFKYLDYAIMQLTETKNQLQVLGIEQKIDFIEDVPKTKEIFDTENKFLQYCISIDQLYKVFYQLQSDFIEFQAQQLRHTNYKNINKFDFQLPPNEFLMLQKRIVLQMLIDCKFEECNNIVIKILDIFGVKDFVVQMECLYDQYQNVMMQLLQLDSVKLINDNDTESSLQSFIFGLWLTSVTMNRRNYAQNVALGLVQRGIRYGFSGYSIFCLIAILKDFDEFNFSPDVAEQLVDQLSTLNIFDQSLIGLINMMSYQLKCKIRPADIQAQNIHQYKMQLYFVQSQQSPYSNSLQISICMYLTQLFIEKKYSVIASFCQDFLKDMSYVNLQSLSQFILQVGLCAMRYIQITDMPPNIGKCETIYESSAILVQTITEMSQSDYTKAFKALYMLEGEPLFEQELKLNSILLKLKCGVDLEQKDMHSVEELTNYQSQQQIGQIKQLWKIVTGIE
ncbi:Conserved_hypothetical protein [Hexamita inflata]|uniref:Protein kinase domain-containing protein n=1 Tax=Hexamita inflata TaxID=28002 RepID=A0AA86RQU8_9EUKA|nr:Conserved hypothetical protein [Hexamita inflata]